MALSNLATTADLTARGITVTSPAEDVKVATFLAEASAVVRDAAGGAPINVQTSTVSLIGDWSQRLRLPSPPVTSVGTVLLDGVAVTDWVLRGAESLYRAAGWRTRLEYPSQVSVVQTHGMAVPADIVGLVCAMIGAALVASRAAADGSGLAASPGITQERIDDYSVTYDEATGETVFALSASTRRHLAARFGSGAGLVKAR